MADWRTSKWGEGRNDATLESSTLLVQYPLGSSHKSRRVPSFIRHRIRVRVYVYEFRIAQAARHDEKSRRSCSSSALRALMQHFDLSSAPTSGTRPSPASTCASCPRLHSFQLNSQTKRAPSDSVQSEPAIVLCWNHFQEISFNSYGELTN